MRSLLESAVYALVCNVSDERRRAWEERGAGDEGRKMSRKLFPWRDLLNLLEGSNKDLAARISDMYDHLIDYDAHRNVDGLALSSDVKHLGQEIYEIITVFAHGREAVLQVVLDLLRCMHYVCQLLFMVIKERLQILGLDAEFLKTSALIHELICQLEAEQKMKVA